MIGIYYGLSSALRSKLQIAQIDKIDIRCVKTPDSVKIFYQNTLSPVFAIAILPRFAAAVTFDSWQTCQSCQFLDL